MRAVLKALPESAASRVHQSKLAPATVRRYVGVAAELLARIREGREASPAHTVLSHLEQGVRQGRWAPHRAKGQLATWAGAFHMLGLGFPGPELLNLRRRDVAAALQRQVRGRGAITRAPMKREGLMKAVHRCWTSPDLAEEAAAAAALLYLGFHAICRPAEIRHLRWDELEFRQDGNIEWVEAWVTDKTHLARTRHILAACSPCWAGAFRSLRHDAIMRRGPILSGSAWRKLERIVRQCTGMSLGHLRPGGNVFWTGRVPGVLIEHAAGWAPGSGARAKHYTGRGAESAELWVKGLGKSA